MKKIDEYQMGTLTGGGDFWDGIACGVGIGLILTGAGGPLGAPLTIVGCGKLIYD